MNIYHNTERKEFYLASVLYDAIEFRHFGSIKSLITDKGANPNLVLPSKGISPFHLAIGCDSANFAEEVTSLILENGGNPNVRSDDGLTPVHIAAAWGRYQLLQLLLHCGGDPQLRDANSRTPVYYAHEGGFADCVQLLRSHYPSSIFEEEKEDAYSLILDKIVVDNGQLVTEFNVVNEYPKRSINISSNRISPSTLHSLPQADMTEYIISWFKKQPMLQSEMSQVHDVDVISDKDIFHFESSPDESDSAFQSEKRTNPRYITFRKVYRKSRKVSKPDFPNRSNPNKINGIAENTVYLDAKSILSFTEDDDVTNGVSRDNEKDFTNCKNFSKESGIVTLPVSEKDSTINSKRESRGSCFFDPLAKDDFSQTDGIRRIINLEDKSSDYLTCSHSSINLLDRNILDLTEDLSVNLNLKLDEPEVDKRKSAVSSVASNELSFVSVSEVYKYVDKDQDIVLYERRLVKTVSECAESIKSLSLSSVPSNIDYDTDTIRRELTLLGYNPGPITVTTKRVYVKKLHQLKKYPVQRELLHNSCVPKKAYSLELEKTLRNTDWCQNISIYRSLEEVLVKEFHHPDPTKKWREGICKASFTYLLLDPRKTANLPCRAAEQLEPQEVWKTFLSAIFYVGKGKRARPYQHLYEAVDLWKKDVINSSSKKIQTIFDIWKTGNGVICLHVFLNVIPVEAYTREAAMISALKLDNLTNVKGGEFYGVPATWNQRQKKMLGMYLLYKAMMIFLNEGERQLCPADID